MTKKSKKTKNIKKYSQDFIDTNEHYDDYEDYFDDTEKSTLNKIGINKDNQDQYLLQDLKQILFCEEIARSMITIKEKIICPIKKIIFFTPKFNDYKPDASNYSCALLTDVNNDSFAIIYRPSYVEGINDDLIVKKFPGYGIKNKTKKLETKIQNENPIHAIMSDSKISLKDIINFTILDNELPSDAINNPDHYLLPLDIVSRPIANTALRHYGIYLGNKAVVHITDEGTKCESWNKFHNPTLSSGSSYFSFFSIFSSNLTNVSNVSVLGGTGKLTRHHPIIPFKNQEVIIEDISKAVAINYGKGKYGLLKNNCEHLVNMCILGINRSGQVDENLRRSPFWLYEEHESEAGFNPPNSSYKNHKDHIEKCIRQAEKNRKYSLCKRQIGRKRFDKRIELRPTPPCKIQ
ncbi:hypothetical protein RclHR1_22650004 [Rhizophagus clarus]|uniref:LRAT domain-containing protein n=1 Tax=Rhizophagus clarus TaxID=94130 RepID=A0A2Z6R889_9GLOM|nr:hypothetical protein RclHR1_22650004 [Rhizophagus clarus]GES83989.1 hypothetical protein GLOIN_2v1640436 [Rhizophagus clarus]